MRTFRDSVAKVTFPLKKHKKIRGGCPLCVPSPYGDVFLRNQILMFHMKQGGVSVPLRGCGFEISPTSDETLKREFVSVPLRGCGFEIGIRGAPSSDIQVFPSPYGDVVLKFLLFSLRAGYFSTSFRPLAGMWFWNKPYDWKKDFSFVFPSPCGDVVLKLSLVESIFKEDFEKFPSPCGDVVLK